MQPPLICRKKSILSVSDEKVFVHTVSGFVKEDNTVLSE
jgi:hypothetical protein